MASSLTRRIISRSSLGTYLTTLGVLLKRDFPSIQAIQSCTGNQAYFNFSCFSSKSTNTAMESTEPALKEQEINTPPSNNHNSADFNEGASTLLANNSADDQLNENNKAPDANCTKEKPITQITDSGPTKKLNLRRKKHVLMLSYCGLNYLGMQRNPNMKTIEEDLLGALLKAGYIDEETFSRAQVASFQRAARTDKHVSAARQIVSLKMPDKIDKTLINEHLPAEIRVMGTKKVTKGFDCKANCDARTYMYMIPTFAFVPLNENVTEAYRISSEVLEELRRALKLYLGTKNFHNFTSRKKPTDPSAQRLIYSFTASDPFVKDGLEYVILKVKGQSFMLHQIRKMIGLVVAFLRGYAGEDTFTKSWTLERIDIPKAPGVGLVLDYVHYERYNRRYGSDGMHEPLTWDECEKDVEDFCQNYIYPVITKSENEDKSMLQWLSTLPIHSYDVRDERANDVTVTTALRKAASLVGKVTADQSDSENEGDDDADEMAPKRRKVDV